MRVFEFADFLLDEAEGVLYREGAPVQLAPKVFDTLLVLVKNHGRVVSKDALMKQVWGNTFVEENNLTQYIFILRKTLSETDSQKFIETVSRRGYRFLPEVVETEKESATVLQPKAKISAVPNNSPRFGNRFILLFVAVVLIVFVSVSFFLRRAVHEKAWAASEIKIKRLTENGKTLAAEISPDGNSYAYVLRDGGIFSLRLKNILSESEIVVVPPEEVEINSPRFSPDGNYIYYAKVPLNSKSEIFQVPVYGGTPRRIAENSMSEFSVSPDGTRIAFPRLLSSEKKHQIIVAKTDGSGETVVAERNDPQFFHLWGPSPAWSSNGEKLIASAGKVGDEKTQLIEINLADKGETEIKTAGSFYFIGSLEWLNEDELFVAAMENRQSKQQLFRIDLNSGEVSRVTNDLSDYLTISFTKKNDKLLTIQETNNFHLWLYDAETGSARQLTFGENHHDGTQGINFAPDGKILYTSRERDELNIFEFNAQTNETRELTKRAGRNFEPAASPDNQSIVFVSDRTGFERLWIMKRDGSEARQLTALPDDKNLMERTPNFSPDGKWIYYLNYSFTNAALYKISINGGAPVKLTLEDKRIILPSLSADGKFLAIGETVNDGTAKIGVISLDGSRERLFDFPAYRMYSRWMPDSQTLVTINNANEGNNLALHNILTGEAKQLTNFNAERIERFAVSPDGKKFAITRGNSATDAVLIEH